MAPLPENATARLFLVYTSAAVQHTLIFRLGAGANVGDAETVAADMATIFKARMLSSDSILSARFSDIGSTFSLPITFSPVIGSVVAVGPSSYWAEDPDSAFISLIGRGLSTARRVRWEFFTPVATTAWPANNRYTPGASAPIDTLRTNFTSAVTGAASPGEQIVTIGGDIPAIYSYVNIAKNSYWQRKQR